MRIGKFRQRGQRPLPLLSEFAYPQRVCRVRLSISTSRTILTHAKAWAALERRPALPGAQGVAARASAAFGATGQWIERKGAPRWREQDRHWQFPSSYHAQRQALQPWQLSNGRGSRRSVQRSEASRLHLLRKPPPKRAQARYWSAPCPRAIAFVLLFDALLDSRACGRRKGAEEKGPQALGAEHAAARPALRPGLLHA